MSYMKIFKLLRGTLTHVQEEYAVVVAASEFGIQDSAETLVAFNARTGARYPSVRDLMNEGYIDKAEDMDDTTILKSFGFPAMLLERAVRTMHELDVDIEKQSALIARAEDKISELRIQQRIMKKMRENISRYSPQQVQHLNISQTVERA